ncbi:MAG: cytochrome c3 family protein [Planctomycetota bacterium]
MNDTSAINGRGGRRGPAGSALGLVAVGAAAVALAGANQASQEKPTTETNDCANTDCHPGLLSRPVMHRPAAQGQCLDCHEFDEPAEHRFNLVVPAEELCWECHDVGTAPTTRLCWSKTPPADCASAATISGCTTSGSSTDRSRPRAAWPAMMRTRAPMTAC